jgi:hypothetical protein
MNNPEQALASYERYREALSKAGQSHKTLIFDALAAADITNVHIEFDGVGDSGQIYCVTAYHGEQKVDRDLRCRPPTAARQRAAREL